MKAELFDLSGKVAIVTGGNGGIGLGMARGLAAAGAAVAIVGRNEAKSKAAVAELTQGGAKAISVTTDVTDKEAVAAMTARVAGELGRIDILVNNAGIYDAVLDAGIVDEDVDAAEFAGHARGHRCDRFLVGDVGRHGNRLGAALGEFGDRRLRLGLVAADDRDRRTGRRQTPGHAEPDAAIAAGDDGDLAAEVEQFCFHACFPLLCVVIGAAALAAVISGLP